MQSRKGTGFVMILGGLASLGLVASAVGSFLPQYEVATAAESRIEGKAATGKTLDSWIRQSLVVMKEQGIPGSYEGIRRNVIRESGGNPKICNNWDINARNGIPSCGLLQVIPPTFKAHRCPGTKNDVTDPVANICAASHYAWKRYGSIDNVNGPY